MLKQLKNIALINQGLVNPLGFGEGIEGVNKAIEHLGYVQIDTLSVVERAHHHILWSRVPAYDVTHLNQLVSDKRIFEHWFHAASYLPMGDYRFALPLMNKVRNDTNKSVDQPLMNEILARVRCEGALGVKGLDTSKKKKGSWWNWGPGKRAVERLFMQGDLMVSSRNGMQKLYDLRERCLPDKVNLAEPTTREYALYLLETTARAHGVFTWKQLLHLKTGKPMRDAMLEVLNERIDAGLISVIEIDNSPCYYVFTDLLEQEYRDANASVKILSPFDNVLIHRERLQNLFAYDFKIECYVPASKRKFGYFCLPILYNNKFVGRIDCKAHRTVERLEVISLHIEDDSVASEQFSILVQRELQNFANFNKCANLKISPRDLQKLK